MLKLVTLSCLTFVHLLGIISAEDTSIKEFVWDVNAADVGSHFDKWGSERYRSPVLFSTSHHSVERHWRLELQKKTVSFGWDTQDFISFHLCLDNGTADSADGTLPLGTVEQFQLFLLNNRTEEYSVQYKQLPYIVRHYCTGFGRFIPKNTVFSRRTGYYFDKNFKFGVRIRSDPVYAFEDFVWSMNENDIRQAVSSSKKVFPQFKTYNNSAEELWQLEVYPNGPTKEFQHYFSIYLCYRGNSTVKTQYELYLLHHESDKTTGGLETNVFTLEKCAGLPDLIPRDVVLNRTNGYFVGDNIKFGVRIQMDYEFKALSWVVRQVYTRGSTLFQFSTNYHSSVQRWKLQVYPNGYEGNQNSFSIILCYDGYDEVEVQYELYLLHHVSQKTSGGLTTETFTFNKCSGSPYLIPRDEILNRTNGYFFRDHIKVGVRIQTNVRTESVPTKKPNYVFEDFVWNMKENDVNRNAQSTSKVILPLFKTYNHSVEQLWQLEVYPEGDSEENLYKLSTDLCYFGLNDVKVQYEMTVLDYGFADSYSGVAVEVFTYGKCARHPKFVSNNPLSFDIFGFGSSIDIGLRIQTERKTVQDQPLAVSVKKKP